MKYYYTMNYIKKYLFYTMIKVKKSCVHHHCWDSNLCRKKGLRVETVAGSMQTVSLL